MLEIAPGEIVEGLEIVLQPGALATLEGRVVTPSGEPAAGATVSSFQDLETWRTAAGGDGRYRLEGLPPGPRTVATTAEGFPPLSSEVDLSPGRNTLDLELVRGFAIAGRVQDREGRPVVQAGVGVYAGEARQGGATGRTAPGPVGGRTAKRSHHPTPRNSVKHGLGHVEREIGRPAVIETQRVYGHAVHAALVQEIRAFHVETGELQDGRSS